MSRPLNSHLLAPVLKRSGWLCLGGVLLRSADRQITAHPSVTALHPPHSLPCTFSTHTPTHTLTHPRVCLCHTHRCSTPVLSEDRKAAIDARMAAALSTMSVEPLAVPVIDTYFHVITDKAGNGNVSDAMVAAQVQVRVG